MESGIQYLKSGIQSVESRIQDCLGASCPLKTRIACVAWRFCRAEAHERRSRELGTEATIDNGVKLGEKNGNAYLKSGELTTKICGKLQWLFIYSFFSVYIIIPCIFLVYTPLKVHGRPCHQKSECETRFELRCHIASSTSSFH